jgi:stage II sporulation protein E
MGSGRDAARVSELAVGFLKNMLVRGRASGELISMLNSFLREGCSSSAQECAATLDLLELDTLSGEAVFYKCGAAPTYVCRGDNLFKLRSRTMPLGILGSPDVKEHRMTFGDGDLVVMMSDGVSGGREDCPYLFDLLRQNSSSLGDGRTAEMIMKYAHSNPEPDDTTVILARVRGEKSGK